MNPHQPLSIALAERAIPAEITLQVRPEKLSAFFESNLVGIVFGELDGALQDGNDEFLRLSGYGHADLASGLRWSNLTPPEFRHLDDAAVSEARARGACKPYEKQYIRKDGTRLWVLVGYALLGPQRDHSVAFVLDIDARKRAEGALEELNQRTERRERLLSATLSSISDFAYTFDREGRFLFANQPLLALWGIPSEQAVGRNFFDLGYPPALAEKLQRQVQEVFETGQSVTDETPYTSPSGHPGSYEYIFSPGLDDAGKVDFVVGSTRDVTERQLSAEALRASAEELRALAEAMPQMVWITRPDGWNIYCSPQWTNYTGLTQEESSGEGWIQPFHPDDREAAREAWQQATATAGSYAIESRLRRTDGTYRWFLIRGVPQRDAAGIILKWFGT
ncbi:MAG: PAS domain S-box protein, partial [Thermoanaerobaculia bacterium]